MMKKILSSLVWFSMIVTLCIPTASAKTWDSDKDIVSSNKSWTIEFNVKMNEAQLRSNQYVKVLNENGKSVDVKRSIDDNKITVTPVNAYKAGEEYRLVIDQSLSSNKGVSMKEDVVMPFTIESSEQNEDVGYEPSAYEKEVLALVNEERAQHGLQPLKLSDSLSSVAHTKAQDMADNGYFNHTSPTYGSPFDMMKQFDISYRAAAENIAAGQRSPEAVVEAWMNSAGHRKNILNPDYTHLGNGYVEGGGSYGTYWVQMFIQK